MSYLNSISVLVIVPAFNAEKTLPELITRLDQYVCRSNLLIVNDGSTDNTQRIIDDLKLSHISFRSNRGKGAALRAGFAYAREFGYRSALTLDADLQHPPEAIPRFYALDDGARVLMGTRTFALGRMPVSRWFSNNLTSLMVSIFSRERVRDSQSGFRLIPGRVLDRVRLTASRYDLESELLLQLGTLGVPVVEVPIPRIYDGAASHINHLGDTLRFIRQLWRRIWA
ncbi:MAG: glycosyltransferase family 2 protein [candidate division Zixibacteria bacterium]|nr:glycosyltransferase family 2 protein [candidate division Zixibacteria bacterium]